MRTSTRAVVVALIAFCLTGCLDSAPTGGRPYSSGASLALLNAGPGVRTADDDFAELAKVLPGFGGLYYDSSGVLTVWLTDTTGRARAASRIHEWMTRGQVPLSLRQVALEAVVGMRLRIAQFDFAQLLSWYRNDVMTAVGAAVNFMDIDETQNRIVLGLWDESKIEAVHKDMAKTGIPMEAVRIIRVEPPASQSAEAAGITSASPWSLSANLRPMPGGAQIQTRFQGENVTCTLGFNARPQYGDGSFGSARFSISNSHCAPPRSQVSGMDLYQPTIWHIVGSEVEDPPFFTNSHTPQCPVGRQCRFTDAALFQLLDPGHAMQGKVAWPHLGETSFYSHMTVTYVNSPVVGRLIRKIGRVTGHTAGYVTNVCVDEDVFGTSLRILCQSIGSYAANTGDSGSPIVELFSDGTSWGVGLHHGSGGRFSPLYAVINELYEANPARGLMNVIVEDSPPQPPPPLTDVQISGPTTVPNGALAEFAAFPVGGTAPYTFTWRVDGAVQAEGPNTFSWSATSSYTLAVTVRDALNATASRSQTITVCPGPEITC